MSPNITMENGSKLHFFGENYEKDKNLSRWDGLIANWFFADEINELQYKSFIKMFERSGRYRIEQQPHPLVVGTCNPSQNWVKEEIYDKWQNGTLPDDILYIPAKITDNPGVTEEYKKMLQDTMPYYEYLVRVEGNWDVKLKTGNEFWKCFDTNKHLTPEGYKEGETIHVSIDDNTYPYITMTVWQIIESEIRQVDELLAKDPDNTVTKAAEKLVSYLNDIGYDDTVFLYGDSSTKNRNTIDENRLSFFDKFREVVKRGFSVSDRVAANNPPVALSGDFINTIYEKEYKGYQIRINENCYASINDYIEVKQDRDGTMLKKKEKDQESGINYEKHGHISDAKRYFIIFALRDLFDNWKNKQSGPISVGYENETTY